MAGTYTDVPSRRFAYDDDGTVAFWCTGVGADAGSFDSEVTAGELATLNNQDTDAVGLSNSSAYGIWFLFPELREVDGVFVAANTGTGFGPDVGMIATADATATNPFGPAWTQSVAAGSTPNITAIPRDNYRTQIVSMAETSERGLAAIRGDTGSSRRFLQLHIYGTISPGETPDRILFIDEATGLEFTGPIDYGDIPRGGSEDYELRLRNNSTTLQANTIQYTAESLGVDGGGGYGGGHGWFTATLPAGSTFSGTNQIASLAASTSTGIITLRRITPGGEEPRLFAPRETVQVDSWT